MSRKIIIDTDPGIDDAMAIFYALRSPELDVIGLTTIFGNAYTDVATVNALRLLEIAERSDIPVCAGADKPLAMALRPVSAHVHGENGQGNVDLPAPTTQVLGKEAADFIIEEVNKAPGKITLAPLGPLTNIALALQRDPDLGMQIKEIVLMGGKVFTDDPTPDMNILSDPEAADIVFAAQCPITMIGLDVTMKVLMPSEQTARLARFDNPRARHLAQIVPFYQGFYSQYLGAPGIIVHDSTVITYLLKPGIFETVQHPIRVALAGEKRGKTMAPAGAADNAWWADRRAVTICMDVDVDEALRMEMERHAT